MEPPKPPRQGTTKQHEAYYKRQALQLIKAQLKLRIGFDNLPDDLPRLIRLQAQDLIAQDTSADLSMFMTSDRERSIAKRDDDEGILRRLIKAMMFSSSIPEFQEDADAFVLGLARHFTIIEISMALVDLKRRNTKFDSKAGEGPLYLDTRVLADALLESLACEQPEIREGAERAILEIHDTAATIFGSTQHVPRLKFFRELAAIFQHGCYEEEWFTKTGGVLGINILLTKMDLGDAWVAERQADFSRALMYVIKDMPSGPLRENPQIGANHT